ncbi:hypothetical protein F5887DRAFT_1193386, partial [Amanita rubescens]
EELLSTASFSFERDGHSLHFCSAVSQGNEYVVTLTGDLANRNIDIVVYRTARSDSITQVWSSKIAIHNPTAIEASLYGREDPSRFSLRAFISSDGESALVSYKISFGDPIYFSTSNHGLHWTRQKDLRPTYDSHGIVSSSGEHIFFRRRGGKFGRAGQAEVVDAYSIRTWQVVKSWTFGFGDGHHIQNPTLIRPSAIDKPIWCSVDNIICSSSRSQFHVGKTFAGDDRVNVSHDGRHLVYLTRDDGLLYYWDLTRPTYEPLISLQLPDVDVAKKYIHRINGIDTVVRHAISKQIVHTRFSPASRVVTVVVANDISIVISSFLTYNFQLVYKKVLPYSLGHVPLYVHMGKNRGVSLVGGAPASWSSRDGVRGRVITFLEVPGAYDAITAVENYFDAVPIIVKSISSNGREKSRLDSRWVVSSTQVKQTSGVIKTLTTVEKKYQNMLKVSLFGDGHYSLADNEERILPLLTFSYPWDPASQVFLFAVRLKYDYSIMALAVVPQTSGSSTPYLLRALYTSEHLVSGADSEIVEVYAQGSHFILYVTTGSGSNRAYSGMQLPARRTTIVGHHFLPEDAEYDVFLVKESTSATMPNGFITTPNTALVYTTSFAAYFPDGYMRCGRLLDYGHRVRAEYNMAKLLMWLNYPHRDRRNEPFFGGGELIKQLSSVYDMVFQDRVYDDKRTLFPSAFATAATLDFLSNQTTLVDEFLRFYHRSDPPIISNAQSISCSLPAVCRVRPLGAVSFMRHIALFKFQINNIGPVEVSNKAHEPQRNRRFSNNIFIRISYEVVSLVRAFYRPKSLSKPVKANTLSVTIPLDSFSSYGSKISMPSSVFYEFAASAYYHAHGGTSPFRYISPEAAVTKGPTSPFSCLVEEIFRLDQETQLSFMQIIWFERLVFWKIDRFARNVYLARLVLPNLVNVVVHLALSLLILDNRKLTAILILASIQVIICLYWTIQLVRRAKGTWLFYRSIFNYLDMVVIALSFTMSIICLLRQKPPRSFIAYSMPTLWINLILSLRIFEPVGVLLILVTEMIKGVLPFLLLLGLFITGFTFIPFFLLRDQNRAFVSNPFHSFSQSLGEVIAFMANNFQALSPWNSMISIQILQSMFAVIVSTLMLNCLIALLSLKVAAAEKRSKNIWIQQMVVLLVEIERGLLTDSERADPYWFPRWFTYAVSEDQRREWQKYLGDHPLHLGYDAPDEKDDGDQSDKPPSLKKTTKTTTTAEPLVPSSSKLSTTQEDVTLDTSLPLTGEPSEPPPAVLTSSGDTNPQQSGSGTKPQDPIPELADADPSQVLSNPGGVNLSGPIPPLKKCQVCSVAASKVCTGCRKVWYCSEEHQLADWRLAHKKACKGKEKEV